jgi:hypothetical protein
MAISKGAKRTDGLESADQVKMVVEEITKKSQTVADLFLIGVETQLRGVDMRSWRWMNWISVARCYVSPKTRPKKR